jgi:Protein of unknown function (DUF3429)
MSIRLSSNPRIIPPMAAWLGGLGLLPFVAGAALVIYPPVSAPLDWQFAVRVYGALILSFLGGVRFGFAVVDDNQRRQGGALFLGVLPALVAWIGMLLPPALGISVLMVGFFVLGLIDTFGLRVGVKPWYGRLRLRLTVAVLLLLSVLLRGVAN